MKTSELIGPALDWAVAKCEGYTLVFFDKFFRLSGLASGISEARIDSMLEFQPLKGKWARRNSVGNSVGCCTEIYGYSIDWSRAGPIIEREEICIQRRPGRSDGWGAHYSKKSESQHFYSVGPTPLIAAMRAFVASRLGDEVEIPSELQP